MLLHRMHSDPSTRGMHTKIQPWEELGQSPGLPDFTAVPCSRQRHLLRNELGPSPRSEHLPSPLCSTTCNTAQSQASVDEMAPASGLGTTETPVICSLIKF